MEYVLSIALFLLGLLFLVKGADVFVDGALFLARRFHLPEFLIGATIVSIGTTLPETVVSITAAMDGHCDVAYGNAIGSIICNTGLIVGLVLFCSAPHVKRQNIVLGTIFFFIAAAVYIAAAVLFHGIPRGVALILLFLFIVYAIFSLKGSKSAKSKPVSTLEPEGKALSHIFKMAIAAGALYFGSGLMMDNVEKFAIWLNVPHKIIALTIVALGTSLPELITAIVSIRKGHGALSVGNILGANLFNLVLVSSISSLVLPTIIDMHAVQTDLIVMLFVMALFTVPIIARSKGSRIQGAALLISYILYITALYHR
ncbi:calcium/sodium antiporter [Christensenellaceae bacterium OttesenSCG-928-M15]|nr:calcium/sodium antiporter [Christensenellaceae bacterium OttesenSCG-928-M15]